MNATLHNIAEARDIDVPYEVIYFAVQKAAEEVGIHSFALSMTAAAEHVQAEALAA